MSAPHSHNWTVLYGRDGESRGGRWKHRDLECSAHDDHDPFFFDDDEENPIYDPEEHVEDLIAQSENDGEREIDDSELGGEG